MVEMKKQSQLKAPKTKIDLRNPDTTAGLVVNSEVLRQLGVIENEKKRFLTEKEDRAKEKISKRCDVHRQHLSITCAMINRERNQCGSVVLERETKNCLVSLWIILGKDQQKKVPNKPELLKLLKPEWITALLEFQVEPTQQSIMNDPRGDFNEVEQYEDGINEEDAEEEV